MPSIRLTEPELLLYRDACEVDENKAGPGVPQETYRVMNTVLEQRGLSGLAEKVTATFYGRTVYQLHYCEA